MLLGLEMKKSTP